jgi:hypothetical protein
VPDSISLPQHRPASLFSEINRHARQTSFEDIIAIRYLRAT